MNSRFALICLLSALGPAVAQKIPDVRCRLEDYKIDSVIYWQAPFKVGDVQVVVLRDPAGEQEARFDLRHGAALVSLRYRGQELLYGQSAGAGVNLFVPRRGSEAELKGLSPYWSSYNPTQGGASMDSPANVTGVACQGQRSMRAFAMMVDRAQNSSFQKEPLLALWKGKISDSLPPGYATPFVIETNADWVEHPGAPPKYYLRLEQSIVNVRPEPTGPMEFFLEGAAPWDFQYSSSFPEKCNEKNPCTSANTPALAAGRYEDEARQHGLAVIAPTAGWDTKRAYIRENSEFVVLAYGAVWAAPRHTFAAVLERELKSIGAHRFRWFVCAGSWKDAMAFAQAARR
jgi:hypothetical protein